MVPEASRDRSMKIALIIISFFFILLSIEAGAFDFSEHSIPTDEILSGGPAKDAIPALSDPAFVSITEASEFLDDSDTVLGVEIEGQAKAYPIKILNWHEAVNDRLGGQNILATW